MYASRSKGRDIGTLVPKCDTDERKECDSSLRRFLEVCFPNAFKLEWSDDHLRLIAAIERAAIFGTLLALAMPRGSGKTTILIRAALWAILTKHRRFLCIVASTEAKARRLLRSIKTEILHNKKLHDLYGAELQAVLALGNESRSAAQQHYRGALTGVEWTVDMIGFGYVEKSQLNGAGISVCGITGNIRGQELTLPNGEVLRPDITLIDDPQTKKSAKSQSQCEERHETMMGDVLGMAGPQADISAICACTVIYQDDLADRLLDNKRSQQWNGEKCKMVYKWPKDEAIWEQYREMYLTGASWEVRNQFVKDNYDRMHDGHHLGWPARRGQNAISGLQYAYELRFRDEASFFAEYQNEPLSNANELPFELDPDAISRRTNQVKRLVVPSGCEKITAQIDVQKHVLFYVVTAWTMGGRGHVIDYGTWPDQKRLRFTKRELRKTLADETNANSLAESIYSGLERLVEMLMTRQHDREGGGTLTIDRIGVDAKWGQSTGTVRRFSRECKYPGRVVPTMGQYVGAKSWQWQSTSNDKKTSPGLHCRMQPSKADTRVREMLIDANWWKSVVAERLSVGKGSEKAILLFEAKPHQHRMFADHCCEEVPSEEETKTGKKLIEWKQPPAAENDYWDCLVGTCVWASWEGVSMDSTEQEPQRKRNTGRKRKGGTIQRPDGQSFFVTAR